MSKERKSERSILKEETANREKVEMRKHKNKLIIKKKSSQ